MPEIPSELISQKFKKFKTWFLAISALPFLIGGLIFSIGIAGDMVTAVKVRNWPAVDASILEAKLAAYRKLGRRGMAMTYEARAKYEYMWQGRRYEGTRVGIQKGRDNVGNTQRERVAVMQKHLKAHTPIPCRVDPSNPSKAVLFPELRIGLTISFAILAMILFVIGSIPICFIVRFSKEKSAQKQSETRS